MNLDWECNKCTKKIVLYAYIVNDKTFCSKKCRDEYIQERTIKNIKKGK